MINSRSPSHWMFIRYWESTGILDVLNHRTRHLQSVLRQSIQMNAMTVQFVDILLCWQSLDQHGPFGFLWTQMVWFTKGAALKYFDISALPLSNLLAETMVQWCSGWIYTFRSRGDPDQSCKPGNLGAGPAGQARTSVGSPRVQICSKVQLVDPGWTHDTSNWPSHQVPNMFSC